MVLMLIVPSAANASLFLIFTPTHASPGDVVHARSGGHGALALFSPGTLLPVYLAPLSAAANITSSSDNALIRVGSLRVDKVGNGRLRFVLPRLPRGPYDGFILCGHWCAAYSAGRVFLPVANGPVLDVSSDIPAAGSGGFSLLQKLSAVVTAGLVAATTALLLWRRRGHPDAT